MWERKEIVTDIFIEIKQVDLHAQKDGLGDVVFFGTHSRKWCSGSRGIGSQRSKWKVLSLVAYTNGVLMKRHRSLNLVMDWATEHGAETVMGLSAFEGKIVVASVSKSSWQLVQRLATGLDCNWSQLDCSCQLRSIVISPVASCPVCQKSKRPVVDRLQPVFLRTGHLAHDPPIQGHMPNFFHIFIYLFEFTRVLSIMVTPKMTYNAKSIISWAPVDQILWFLDKYKARGI